MHKLAFAFACCLLSFTLLANAQDTPPGTYESPGVCPFECCTYRAWTADDDVPVHASRSDDSPVRFHIQRDEVVDGVTGVVVTEHPAPIMLDHAVHDGYIDGRDEPQLSLKAGDVVYMLTPLGEGAYLFWYKGKVYRAGIPLQGLPGVEGSGMKLTWWQQVRNKAGQTGWAKQGRFRNVDACG